MAINTVINTNMMALTANRNLATVGNRQAKANQRLSSGKKINSAADDAAGLAISEKMKAQIKGLDMASKNSEDAISLIQTAEGSLTEVNNMLTRVRELTVQAGNDTNQTEDRVKIAEEVATLLTEIDSISTRTEFNEKKLNDGSFRDGYFQIGSNSGQGLNLGVGNMSVFGIGMNEIMETFGVEKKVDVTATSSAIGVVGASETSSTTTAALTQITGLTANTKTLTTGKVEIKTLVNGVEETLSFDLDLSAAKITGVNISGADLANEVAKQLNNNSDFTKNFKASASAAGKLTFEANEVGGEIQFGSATPAATDVSITFGKLSDNSAAPAVQNNLGTTTGILKGHYGEINFKNLADGDTITIAGKTFTKVADAKTASETYGGFSDIDELQNLLAADGVSTTKNATNTILTLDFATQESGLSGTYSINAKNISTDGKQFSKMIENIDESLKAVTTQRAKLGANQNRLEYTINSLNLSSENLSAAKSRIEDTDMAKEMMNLTQANVLQQAATTILAQANQAPNQITQLLG